MIVHNVLMVESCTFIICQLARVQKIEQHQIAGGVPYFFIAGRSCTLQVPASLPAGKFASQVEMTKVQLFEGTARRVLLICEIYEDNMRVENVSQEVLYGRLICICTGCSYQFLLLLYLHNTYTETPKGKQNMFT